VAQKPAGPDPRSQQPSRPADEEWTPVVRTGRRRAVALVVVLSMVLALVGGTVVSILSAGSASAHDQLVGSDPKDGAELEKPVTSVTLEYSAEIIADGTQVRATTPDGEVDADVTVDGTDVVVDLGEQTSGGEYDLAWRVVSSDGHPIEGELSWTVADQPEPTPSDEATPSDEPSETAESPEAAASDAAAEPAPSSSPAQSTDDDGSIPLLYGAALVAIIGVALALLVRSRRRLHDQAGPGPNGAPED
jgi:methionine-rich copper-binding protein CopC